MWYKITKALEYVISILLMIAMILALTFMEMHRFDLMVIPLVMFGIALLLSFFMGVGFDD